MVGLIVWDDCKGMSPRPPGVHFITLILIRAIVYRDNALRYLYLHVCGWLFFVFTVLNVTFDLSLSKYAQAVGEMSTSALTL